MSKKLISDLKIVLANTYVLLLKTQNYHWNVTGPNFQSLHLMFEAQYNDLFQAVDLIAERIRALGEFVPASFDEYQKITNITECNSNVNAQYMVKDIANDQEKMISSLTNVLKESQKTGDEVTLSMMADRIEIHQKNAWMLRSSIE